MKYTSEEIKNRLSNIGEAIGTIALECIVELEKENEQLKIDNYNHNANLQRLSNILDESTKIIKDLLWSEIHYCTGEEFCNIRSRAEIFINNEEEE